MQLSSSRYQATRLFIFAVAVFAFMASAVAYPQASESPGTQKADTQKKDTAVYQSQTVLRATTRLVIVDAVVLDEKGQPITDLTVRRFHRIGKWKTTEDP